MNSKKSLSQALLYFVAAIVVFTGCSGKSPESVLPLKISGKTGPEVTLIWVGRGEAYRHSKKNEWVRAASSDYEFSVIQRRYKNYWESTKEMHYLHPNYNGAAGARDQSLFFRVDYEQPQHGKIQFRISSTLGDGNGVTDTEFRRTDLQMKANISSFAPYNTYRLKQHYLYEEGQLNEEVSLIKLNDDGTSKPFLKIIEKAELFSKNKFLQAPTQMGTRNIN